MWRKPACQTLLKALNISSAAAWVAILSDTTVRRSAVDWEDIKPYRKSQKRKSQKTSRTLLQQLLACLNLTLNLNQKNYSVGTNKKVISMNYDSSTSSWKPWRWRRLGLILKMRDIYINSNLNPLTKFTSRSRSTELKDVLPWNIFQITKTIPSQSGWEQP